MRRYSDREKGELKMAPLRRKAQIIAESVVRAAEMTEPMDRETKARMLKVEYECALKRLIAEQS